MKNSRKNCVIRALVLIPMTIQLTACATSRGFDRTSLRGRLDEAPVVRNLELQKNLRPELPKPFKLGVIFKSGAGWSWDEADKRKICSAFDSWIVQRKISKVSEVRGENPSDGDLHKIRLAAQQQGFEALLVVSGIKDVDKYDNGWAWTYIAAFPALFVPGSNTDVLFLAHATLWDVRNKYLYMTADSESLQGLTRPAAFTHELELTDSAKADAAAALADRIAKNLATISERGLLHN